MLVLRHFDSIHFAGLVHCPVPLGAGLADVAVPDDTANAVANHLSGPVEITGFPASHTDRTEEALWNGFEARREQLAAEDIPADFGRTRPDAPRPERWLAHLREAGRRVCVSVDKLIHIKVLDQKMMHGCSVLHQFITCAGMFASLADVGEFFCGGGHRAG